MDELDRLCLRLSRRRRIERVLARLLPVSALAGLVGATVLAVVRLAVPDAGWLVPALLACAILAPLVVLPAALRRRDPPWLIAGLADRLAGTQGTVMALAALPQHPADWLERIAPALRSTVLPPLRWPHLPAAVAALALLVGSFFLPQVSAPPPPLPVISAGLNGADAAVQRLADEGLAPPEAVQALAERLETVRAALAEQGLNQQTWAALDALNHDLDAARANASDRLADALAKAEALAALAADGNRAAAAAADLAAALADLAQQAPGLGLQLPAGAEGEALLRLAQQAMAGGELTEAQRQALQRFGLDPAKLPAGAAQPGDAAEAARLAGRLAGLLAERAGMRGPPGQPGDPGGPDGGDPGGGTDGGGHVELTWGDIQRVAGGYRDRLESGAPRHPETGATVATQARAPRDDERSADPAGRAAPVEHASAAADARRATVAPRHRAAVAGYFAATPAPP